MDEQSKKDDKLLETTDCLEAIGTLKSNKNFFFFVSFLCLLILQGIFWLMPTEYVDRSGTDTQKDVAPVTAMLLKLAVSAKHDIKVENKAEKIEKAAQVLTADANAAKAEPNSVEHNRSARPKISFSHLSWLIKLCNYLLVVCSVIYSLTLLFCLKISLVGRLGGIRHITKAVFISFFMIVLLLPWQILFKSVIVGAIYTPAELLNTWTGFDETAIVSNIVMFLRFTGLWLIVTILLCWAQLKSMRWSRNTLKRLGIVS
jgi:hypothetical protein